MFNTLQVMGYKGVPILAIHPPFNLVKGIVADYLHCVLLGVSKMLLKLWLQGANHSKAFYVGGKVTVCM